MSKSKVCDWLRLTISIKSIKCFLFVFDRLFFLFLYLIYILNQNNFSNSACVTRFIRFNLCVYIFTDYELIATLTRVLIPLSLFLIFGIIFAICFYKQRKKAHAQYLGKSGTGSGSNAEGFFGSPALENYPAPPPQAQQTSVFGVNS